MEPKTSKFWSKNWRQKFFWGHRYVDSAPPPPAASWKTEVKWSKSSYSLSKPLNRTRRNTKTQLKANLNNIHYRVKSPATLDLACPAMPRAKAHGKTRIPEWNLYSAILGMKLSQYPASIVLCCQWQGSYGVGCQLDMEGAHSPGQPKKTL